MYHSYLCNSGIIDPYNVIWVAPDEGARNFFRQAAPLSEPFLPYIMFRKTDSIKESYCWNSLTNPGYLSQHLKLNLKIEQPLYIEDISEKNPRSATKSFHKSFIV